MSRKIYSEKIPWRPREYYMIQPERLSLLERIKKHGLKARIFGSSSKSKPKSSTLFSAIKKLLALGGVVIILAFLFFFLFL